MRLDEVELDPQELAMPRRVSRGALQQGRPLPLFRVVEVRVEPLPPLQEPQPDPALMEQLVVAEQEEDGLHRRYEQHEAEAAAKRREGRYGAAARLDRKAEALREEWMAAASRVERLEAEVIRSRARAGGVRSASAVPEEYRADLEHIREAIARLRVLEERLAVYGDRSALHMRGRTTLWTARAHAQRAAELEAELEQRRGAPPEAEEEVQAGQRT